VTMALSIQPTALPAIAIIVLSVNSWRMTRVRLAPSDVRIRISRSLVTPRASNSEPRLAQATTRINSTSVAAIAAASASCVFIRTPLKGDSSRRSSLLTASGRSA